MVPLYADYTHENAEIKKWLDKFDSISVPLTVIFPQGDLDNPVILRDSFTQASFIEALNRATRSGDVAKVD